MGAAKLELEGRQAAHPRASAMRDFALGCTITAALCALWVQHRDASDARAADARIGRLDMANVRIGRLDIAAAVGVSSRPLTRDALIERLPRAVVGPADARRRSRLTDDYLEAAAAFDGSRGEGRKGWLALLAAHDLSPTDDFILEQLVDNYVRANYPQLAIDQLRHGPASRAASAGRLLADLEARGTARSPPVAPAPASTLPSPELLVPFAGVVGRWDLAAPARDPAAPQSDAAALSAGNRQLYDASLRAYFRRADILQTGRGDAAAAT